MIVRSIGLFVAFLCLGNGMDTLSVHADESPILPAPEQIAALMKEI